MIALTASWNPGDDYPGGPYTHVEISQLKFDHTVGKVLILDVEYGTESGGSFLKNSDEYPPKEQRFEGAGYDTYKALATAVSTMGAEEDRCRHQCMLDLGRYAGTLA